MRAIAIFRDGQLISAEGELISEAPRPVSEPSRAVAAPVWHERTREPPRNVKPLDVLDRYNEHLAAAIRLAQDMSPEDQQRASEFMEAARATLTATTRLKAAELRKWQAALRNA
jgi:hypothetical protein